MTDPATIEAAARALRDKVGSATFAGRSNLLPLSLNDLAAAVLTAVTPLIRAAVLEEAPVVAEVAAERRRQIEAEGWMPEHDDEHSRGELARAAVCYADPLNEERENPPPKWPWAPEWWKPKDRRRDLLRAAALIVAEIERLDRIRALKEQP